MKKHTLIKTIVLILSWLTLSPLLLILDGRWKLLPKWLRIALFVVSPMMLLILTAAAFRGYTYYSDYCQKYHFVRPNVVENITGIKFPKYKFVETNSISLWCVRGEFSYGYTLEFKRMPDDSFYEKLDQVFFKTVEDGKTLYSFEQIWGNGLPAPKGESDEEDYDFKVRIEKGSKQFYIDVMMW